MVNHRYTNRRKNTPSGHRAPRPIRNSVFSPSCVNTTTDIYKFCRTTVPRKRNFDSFIESCPLEHPFHLSRTPHTDYFDLSRKSSIFRAIEWHKRRGASTIESSPSRGSTPEAPSRRRRSHRAPRPERARDPRLEGPDGLSSRFERDERRNFEFP